jgi:hypothetical protein
MEGDMRRLGLVVGLFVSLASAGLANAAPQWLTLPPTPTLPETAESGYAPVNGIKIWYAVYG